MEIIEAHERGEVIQIKHGEKSDFYFLDRQSSLPLDFINTEYRIKPTPRECWRLLHPYGYMSDMSYSNKRIALAGFDKSKVKAVKFVEVIE